MTALLRVMTSADLPAVLRLEHELFTEDAWSAEMFQGELDDQPRTRHYVVAAEPAGPEGREEIVGYAGLAAAGGQGDVQTIGVRPDKQGYGVGTALLTALLEEAGRRHCEAVFLEVRSGNDRARKLYERFGFTDVSVRKRYYQPSGADAIVMCRHSGDPRSRPGKGVFGFGFGFGPSGGMDA
jgi:ribosomal-protein-alanine N-acetyltransferase